MSVYVATGAQQQRRPYPIRDEKIEDIGSLEYLKKYACQKVKYRREWYFNCVECAELKKCKAGQQAMVLMERDTKAEEKPEPMDPKKQAVIDIFENTDPIRYLLENSGNVKPQSIYAKVNVWRKNYPDLEAKYKMTEKVKFLWQKPYDSMRVPDILKSLYPDAEKKPEADISKEVKAVDTASMHPSSIISVDPISGNKFGTDPQKIKTAREILEEHYGPKIEARKQAEAPKKDIPKSDAPKKEMAKSETAEGDCISLEEFLSEYEDSHDAAEDIPEPVKEPVKEAPETPEELAGKDILRENGQKGGAPTVIPKAAGSDQMDILLDKLESEKKSLYSRINEINEQIKAVNMVKKLMQTS